MTANMFNCFVKGATPVFCCDIHRELWKDEENKEMIEDGKVY